MSTKKRKNSYDETKRMLNTIREIQSKGSYGQISEQTEVPNPPPAATYQQPKIQTEDSDYTVINDVEVVVHSEDPEDMELTDEEKGKISQLIDDFRAEVAETGEFDKLHIYETSSKLDGKIGQYGLAFTLSTGDDTGLYINGQMMKIDENSLLILEKLGRFQVKFSNTINDLLVRRRST